MNGLVLLFSHIFEVIKHTSNERFIQINSFLVCMCLTTTIKHLKVGMKTPRFKAQLSHFNRGDYSMYEILQLPLVFIHQTLTFRIILTADLTVNINRDMGIYIICLWLCLYLLVRHIIQKTVKLKKLSLKSKQIYLHIDVHIQTYYFFCRYLIIP